MSDVDDFFGDETEEDVSLGHEGRARETLFRSHGYRDGITAGKNDSVQEGFNIGFIEGAKASYRWGQARGIASALASLPLSLSSQLMTSDWTIGKVMTLNTEIEGISTQDAAKMFYTDRIQTTITRKPTEVSTDGPKEVLDPRGFANSCFHGGTSLASVIGYSQVEATQPENIGILSQPSMSNSENNLESNLDPVQVSRGVSLNEESSVEKEGGKIVEGEDEKCPCGAQNFPCSSGGDNSCNGRIVESSVVKVESKEAQNFHDNTCIKEVELGVRLEMKIGALLRHLEGSSINFFDIPQLQPKVRLTVGS